MDNFNIYRIYYQYFKSKPFISVFSIIFLLFYVLLTIFFPRYYGGFISNLNSFNTIQFNNKLYALIIVYILLWLGTLIHYTIIHSYLLKSSRSFFLKEIFYPVWNQIESGNIKENVTSHFTKDLLTLTITSSQTLQGLIFIAIPSIFSIILFIYYLPNIIEIKAIVIITFFIFLCLIYTFSYIIKQKSSDRLEQTKKNLELIEDNIHNKLSIFNYNTFKQESDIFIKNCDIQEHKCYNNGMYQIYLTISCILILLIGLLTPVFILKHKMNRNAFKIFIISYIPMLTSIILILYASLNRFIAFFQTFGEQEKAIHNINSYILNHKPKKSITLQQNKNLKLINIKLVFNKNVVFNNLNMEFHKGITLIKGQIGSGKSCILKMIFGTLNYQDGNIMYKHYSKNNIDIHTWRQKIIYLDQFPYMFETKNIHNNIYYNNKLNNVIDTYQLKNNVIDTYQLKDKFNYLLNNNMKSSQLSGGEKQIIHFIRSLSENNKEIYLLDEPTASLDKTMRHKIYNMVQLLKDKVVIIVSHDNYFEKISDHIIDIQDFK